MHTLNDLDDIFSKKRLTSKEADVQDIHAIEVLKKVHKLAAREFIGIVSI